MRTCFVSTIAQAMITWELMFPDEECDGMLPGGSVLPIQCLCGHRYQIPMTKWDTTHTTWANYVNNGGLFYLDERTNLMWCPNCKPPEQLDSEKREGA